MANSSACPSYTLFDVSEPYHGLWFGLLNLHSTMTVPFLIDLHQDMRVIHQELQALQDDASFARAIKIAPESSASMPFTAAPHRS